MFRRTRGSTLTRSRWAGIGAAVAVSLGAGGIGLIAHAASSAPSSFVSITPCRLFDTRPAPLTVGDRNTALTAGEDLVRPVWGTNGNCTIPTTATGISYNLTVPTGINGFLTVYPSDAARPLSSNINPVGGEGVKANSGIVGLSAAGAITVYTLNGPTDALMDITGYFLPASAGPPGPPGAAAVGGVEFGSGPADTTLTVNQQATVVASIVVTAPSAGFVVVSASASLLVTANASARCTISTGTAMAGDRLDQITLLSYSTWSGVQGFAVGAGANTFNFVCQLENAGTSVDVWDPTMTAVFSATRL